MKMHVTFLQNSTGYKPGSIPPVFAPEYVTPIPMCGSLNTLKIDGRYGWGRALRFARSEAAKRPGCVGFQIVKMHGDFRPDTVIHKEIF